MILHRDECQTSSSCGINWRKESRIMLLLTGVTTLIHQLLEIPYWLAMLQYVISVVTLRTKHHLKLYSRRRCNMWSLAGKWSWCQRSIRRKWSLPGPRITLDVNIIWMALIKSKWLLAFQSFNRGDRCDDLIRILLLQTWCAHCSIRSQNANIGT